VNEQVFRALPRAVTLAGAFLVGAVLFGFGAAMPSASAGARIGLGIIAFLFFVVAVRCAFMRIVAGPGGLKLHGPLFNLAFRWADVRSIPAAETEVDARTFGVRTPVIVLADGRKVKAQPVSSFSLFSGDDTEADRIAVELERLRQRAVTS
jgi:hypothetical protein